MRTTTLLAALALGCNSVAGIEQPFDKAPAASSGGPTASGADRFVGTWTTITGVQDVMDCPFAQRLTGQHLVLVLTLGTTAGTIVVTSPDNDTCNLVLGVEGDVASIITDQTCVVNTGTETDTYRYTTPTTFTLSSDGAQSTALVSATIHVAPQNETCQFLEQSTYTKQ